MSQIGPGAKYYERKIRFAGGCTDSPNCEARVGNNWELLSRTALAPVGCEQVVMRYDSGNRSAGELEVPKLTVETMSDN